MKQESDPSSMNFVTLGKLLNYQCQTNNSYLIDVRDSHEILCIKCFITPESCRKKSYNLVLEPKINLKKDEEGEIFQRRWTWPLMECTDPENILGDFTVEAEVEYRKVGRLPNNCYIFRKRQ